MLQTTSSSHHGHSFHKNHAIPRLERRQVLLSGSYCQRLGQNPRQVTTFFKFLDLGLNRPFQKRKCHIQSNHLFFFSTTKIDDLEHICRSYYICSVKTMQKIQTALTASYFILHYVERSSVCINLTGSSNAVQTAS